MKPDWVRLQEHWRRRGGTGLSLPFLSWALGQDPEDVLASVEASSCWGFNYCHQTQALVLMHTGGRVGTFNPFTQTTTREVWRGYGKNRRKYMVTWARKLLLAGTPSRHYSRSWIQPSKWEENFVFFELGRAPQLPIGQDPKTKKLVFRK